MADTKPRAPLSVRILCVLMTLVVSGVGLLAVITEYAPARATRQGVVGPLDGSQATWFGVTVLLAGLLPLAMLMGTARRAAWFGGIVSGLVVASLFVGLRFPA